MMYREGGLVAIVVWIVLDAEMVKNFGMKDENTLQKHFFHEKELFYGVLGGFLPLTILGPF